MKILVRCNGFARIQKAVLDQTSSTPPNSDHGLFFWYKFGFGKCFGASFWTNHWLVIANCMKVKSRSVVSDSCDSMDCSLPGFSVHGIFLARVLEWVAFSFSRGSSQPRDRTQVSRIAGRCFTLWATREAHYFLLHVTIWLRNCCCCIV